MIESAVTKLTFAYLAILMCLSIGFSLLLYRVSSVALENGLRQPRQAVFRETSLYDYESFRQTRLHEVHDDVRDSLIILNVITFAGGFAASYLLARRTLEPIERALASQKRFAADASHELRTPLTSMQSEIEVALRDSKLKLSDAKSLLASNLEEVQRLRRLSDNLLLLARQEKKPHIEAKKVQLQKVLLDAVDAVEKQADAKRIQIDLPNTDTSVKIDSESLHSILKILLDNAIKYSDKGSTVKLQVHADKELLTVSVQDQGIGIDAADMEKIFDRFYRADSSRSSVKAEGHGLGLSIAKKMAETHGWWMSVDSHLGKGSTFTVNIPIT